MTTSWPPALRRAALGPLTAMAALGLTAGFLIGQDAARAGSASDPAPTAVPAPTPSVPVASPGPGTSGPGASPSATTGDARRAMGRLTTDAVPQTRYRFLLTQPGGGGAIRWNPCLRVAYKIALGDEVTADEVPYVQAAFDAAGKGLGGARFVYEGMTDVVPDAVDDSARAHADIVFAFAEAGSGAAASDLLSGWEAGRGGFAAANVTTHDGVVRQRPTHGSVVVDVSKWRVMSRHDRDVLYLHEIGHAVGLDHPKDGRQIMSSGAYDLPAEYQPGDLAGLARLGLQAGCE